MHSAQIFSLAVERFVAPIKEATAVSLPVILVLFSVLPAPAFQESPSQRAISDNIELQRAKTVLLRAKARQLLNQHPSKFAQLDQQYAMQEMSPMQWNRILDVELGKARVRALTYQSRWDRRLLSDESSGNKEVLARQLWKEATLLLPGSLFDKEKAVVDKHSAMSPSQQNRYMLPAELKRARIIYLSGFTD